MSEDEGAMMLEEAGVTPRDVCKSLARTFTAERIREVLAAAAVVTNAQSNRAGFIRAALWRNWCFPHLHGGHPADDSRPKH